MTPAELLAILREQPLVVSVQALEGSAVDDTETLLRLAQASIAEGVKVLRLDGAERVQRIRTATNCIAIGLIKRRYPDSDVYITPTETEVDELLETGCEVIALDATLRRRPGRQLDELIHRIHAGGVLAMADCDSPESASCAIAAGADIIGTTLAGYTPEREPTSGPDLELLRSIRFEVARDHGPIILAEGRYSERWHLEVALRIGADAVVVGGAINDPVKKTRAMLSTRLSGDVGAVDIGGTWIRFATFTSDWKIGSVLREPLPEDPLERQLWIGQRIRETGVSRVGVSTGGVVDPVTATVVSAKGIVPRHAGTRFAYDVPTIALNDGLATAWGHACLPEAAGKRVATLALGTGVGCGFVADGAIWMGRHGDYPRLNDLPFGDSTVEDLLGGSKLSDNPNLDQVRSALGALRLCAHTIRSLLFAELIYVCGGVGLSSYIANEIEALGMKPSPFGEHAGLYGAAALALYRHER